MLFSIQYKQFSMKKRHTDLWNRYELCCIMTMYTFLDDWLYWKHNKSNASSIIFCLRSFQRRIQKNAALLFFCPLPIRTNQRLLTSRVDNEIIDQYKYRNMFRANCLPVYSFSYCGGAFSLSFRCQKAVSYYACNDLCLPAYVLCLFAVRFLNRMMCFIYYNYYHC